MQWGTVDVLHGAASSPITAPVLPGTGHTLPLGRFLHDPRSLPFSSSQTYQEKSQSWSDAALHLHCVCTEAGGNTRLCQLVALQVCNWEPPVSCQRQRASRTHCPGYCSSPLKPRRLVYLLRLLLRISHLFSHPQCQLTALFYRV